MGGSIRAISDNEVDDIAKLGYDGNHSVSITAKDKDCSFSIGGASVDGKGIDFGLQQQVHQSRVQASMVLGTNPSSFFDEYFPKYLRMHEIAHGLPPLPELFRYKGNLQCDRWPDSPDSGEFSGYRISCFKAENDTLSALDKRISIQSIIGHYVLVISRPSFNGRILYIFLPVTEL